MSQVQSTLNAIITITNNIHIITRPPTAGCKQCSLNGNKLYYLPSRGSLVICYWVLLSCLPLVFLTQYLQILPPLLGCSLLKSKSFPTHFPPTSVGRGDSVVLVCYIVFYPCISSFIFHGFVKHSLHMKKIVLFHICEHHSFFALSFNILNFLSSESSTFLLLKWSFPLGF